MFQWDQESAEAWRQVFLHGAHCGWWGRHCQDCPADPHQLWILGVCLWWLLHWQVATVLQCWVLCSNNDAKLSDQLLRMWNWRDSLKWTRKSTIFLCRTLCHLYSRLSEFLLRDMSWESLQNKGRFFLILGMVILLKYPHFGNFISSYFLFVSKVSN